jgi:hypothetical protein
VILPAHPGAGPRQAFNGLMTSATSIDDYHSRCG